MLAILTHPVSADGDEVAGSVRSRNLLETTELRLKRQRVFSGTLGGPPVFHRTVSRTEPMPLYVTPTLSLHRHGPGRGVDARGGRNLRTVRES